MRQSITQKIKILLVLKMEIFLKHHFQFGYLLSLLQAKLQNSFIITNLKTITELPSSVKQQRS